MSFLEPDVSDRPGWWPFAALLVGAAVVISVLVFPGHPETTAAAPVARPARQSRLLQTVSSLQGRLHRLPDDATGWAELGSAYVELARITVDPAYYGKAQGALDRSLKLRPEGNGPAMIGMGALANSRHDFAAAKDWGLRAKAAQPASAEIYGVLADALTQLGDDTGTTEAVQQMLDLRPNVASFTRASYYFETHGRETEARDAMNRALDSATSADETAFCRYYLGELEFAAGRLDEADQQYETGLVASPGDPALSQGRAKVAAARGDFDRAVAGYRDIVARAPLPQYLAEYAELLAAAGRATEADQQFQILAQQQRLMEAQGATDDLSAALVAADHGDKAEALRRAQAEWGRRQSVFAADAMAWALHVNGRDAEAVEFADKAAALGWRNATFAYHRGMINAALGKKAEAEQFLADAVRRSLSSWHAPKAKQALAELRSSR